MNAEKVAVSGKKRSQKLYRRHSGRPGGMKVETFNQLQQRIPERIIEHAVRGMLPKGRVSSDLPLSEHNQSSFSANDILGQALCFRLNFPFLLRYLGNQSCSV